MFHFLILPIDFFPIPLQYFWFVKIQQEYKYFCANIMLFYEIIQCISHELLQHKEKVSWKKSILFGFYFSLQTQLMLDHMEELQKRVSNPSLCWSLRLKHKTQVVSLIYTIIRLIKILYLMIHFLLTSLNQSSFFYLHWALILSCNK